MGNRNRGTTPQDGNLEKKFLRTRDPHVGHSNLVYSGGPGIDLKNQRSPATSISSSKAAPKYTIPPGTLSLTSEMYYRSQKPTGRHDKTEEINQKLNILRQNAMANKQTGNYFNSSREGSEHFVAAEPTDIDEDTDRDSRSEISSKMHLQRQQPGRQLY